MTLPSDWQSLTINELGIVVSGGTPSTTDDTNFGDEISWITPADLTDYREIFIGKGRKSITAKGLSSSSARLIPKNSILFSSRAPIGYVAIASNELTTNQGFKTLIPNDDVYPKYVYYYLKSAKPLAESMASGTTFKELSGSAFKNMPIPLAPFGEQKRIVAKIEELLSELDSASSVLEKSKISTSAYWRAKKSKLVIDVDLPTITLSEITERIQIGPFGSQLHKHDYIEGGIPLINPANISDGKIYPNHKKSITKQKYSELPMYHLLEGDVVLGRRGEMGRSALVTKAESGWFCGTGSIFIRPDETKLRPAFLAELLSSEYAVAYLENEAGGTTMSNLNKKILANFPVPLPSPERQDEILSEIEALKTEVSTTKKIIANSLIMSSSLKQSILSKAFKGELA